MGKQIEETTLGAELKRLGLLGRINMGLYGKEKLDTHVARSNNVCTDEDGVFFVHQGGGLALYMFARLGGSPGNRYLVQTGFSVLVVMNRGHNELLLSEYA